MRRLHLNRLIYFLVLGSSITFHVEVMGQKKDSTSLNKAKVKSGKLKNDLKKIKKVLSFKNFFHHDDSAKLARQYVHEQHQLTKGKKGYPYQVDHKSLGLNVETYAPSTAFDLKYEVFGWYPYWEKDLYKSLNFSLLSTIAYFSYELNAANGNPITIHDWKTSPMIDSAKANGKKVLLTVTSFGKLNNRRFLNNDKAINTLITQLKALLKERGADGVSLDIEGVATAQKDKFSKFITLLSQELKKVNPNYLVYLTIPSVDWEKYLDLQTLTAIVDRFIIMGYGYYGPVSKVAGPVDPLKSDKLWEPYNLSLSVEYYLANNVPASKLILALPFYGSIWETESADLGGKVKKFVGSRTYDYIRTNVTTPVRYDTVSKSVWSSYVVGNSDTFRQCWYDNDSTFSVKIDYIKSKKIKGLGIWALGFDKGFNDLWAVIGKHLTNNKITGSGVVNHLPGGLVANNKTGNTTLNSNTENGDIVSDNTASGGTSNSSFKNKIDNVETLLQTITNYKTLILWVLLFVVLFGGAGLIIAMFQPDTRMFFFGNTAFTVYYTAFVLLFLILVLRWVNIINNLSIALIIGFVFGAAGIYFVNKIIERLKRNMP